MTLHVDPAWAASPGSWLHEWCLDCDYCGTHTHIPPGLDDPRMSDRCDGWRLDVDGKDYCSECSGTRTKEAP